jgi:hypothetical protein
MEAAVDVQQSAPALQRTMPGGELMQAAIAVSNKKQVLRCAQDDKHENDCFVRLVDTKRS